MVRTIFNEEEKKLIKSVQIRKTAESAMMATDCSSSNLKKSILIKQLSADILLCSVMIRIADNDLKQLDDDLQQIEMSALEIPEDLYDEYLDSMTPESVKQEHAFMFLRNYIIAFLPVFSNARVYSEMFLLGKEPLSYSDILNLKNIKDIFLECRERCIGLLDNTDLPYTRALQYIDLVLEECSIMNRISSGKDLSLKEVSEHEYKLNTINSVAFNKLFLPDIYVSDRRIVLSFDERWMQRFEMMLGKCIADAELRGEFIDRFR